MTRPLWTPDELMDALGPATAPLTRPATGVSIDTRTLSPGDLFIAIKGESQDGHEYVGRAFAAGAVAAIVAREPGNRLPSYLDEGPLFVVEDTLSAMEGLGQVARRRSRARILAITGSVGKTSSKEMARVALSALGPTHASAASYNNHWGVPLTLARLPADAAYGVFEIGMNHPGEITPLIGLVRPHVALVTTIGPVHIEHFGSLEAIADAKAEIFSGVVAFGGVAVLNQDAPQFDRLNFAAEKCGLTVLPFGSTEEAKGRLISCVPYCEGSHVIADIAGRRVSFSLGAPGRHMAENAVGVLLAVEALGAIEIAAAALAAFAPAKGRGERFTLSAPAGPFTLIDESYNANPVSMRAALALLGAAKPGPGGRRIAVIGDMLELGADGAALHAGLAADLEANQVDLLFGAGALTRALYEAAPAATRGAHAERAEALRAPLVAALRAGDVVMIKGSNGSRMGPLTAALREHFSPGDCGAGRSTC